MVGRSRPTALTSLSTEDVANGSRPKFNRQPGPGIEPWSSWLAPNGSYKLRSSRTYRAVAGLKI